LCSLFGPDLFSNVLYNNTMKILCSVCGCVCFRELEYFLKEKNRISLYSFKKLERTLLSLTDGEERLVYTYIVISVVGNSLHTSSRLHKEIQMRLYITNNTHLCACACSSWFSSDSFRRTITKFNVPYC